MKIAIFGGSFDPVHAEHINIVKAAAEKLETDKIIVIPAYIPPHKQGKSLASAQDRLNMAKLAFGPIKNCEVSSFEISAGGTSYTYRTLQYFREKYPQATFYLLVGADMLKDFYTWKEPESILSNAELVAAGREGEPGRAEGGSVPVGAGSDDRSHHRGMRDKTVCGEGAFP